MDNHISSWAQYSIMLNNNTERKELMKILKEEGIPTAIFYKKPFNKLNIYSDISDRDYPLSENISKRILSLPMHPYLSKRDLDKIICIIKDFYND